jgi:hypothetical protein
MLNLSKIASLLNRGPDLLDLGLELGESLDNVGHPFESELGLDSAIFLALF